MMKSYRSLHRNHVHQLILTVSKHYYITKEGKVKYQSKPMDVDLESLSESKRTNIILASIRDHCTGMFYCEFFAGPDIPSVANFLLRAWASKDDFKFSGLPLLLSIPKKLEKHFPELESDLDLLGVARLDVTSGFQGGISDIKTIEARMCFFDGVEFDEVVKQVPRIYITHANDKGRNGVMTKVEMWDSSDFPISAPPSQWPVNASQNNNSK